jgi:hypothetical protein
MENLRCKIIYSVDDECFTAAVWRQFEQDRTFGDVRFTGSDRISDAVEYARHAAAPVLYVLDAHMAVEESVREEALRILKQKWGGSCSSMGEERVASGLFGGVVLKSIQPECRVLLLTAWLEEIREMEKDETVGCVMREYIDCEVGKPCDERTLRAAVQKYV